MSVASEGAGYVGGSYSAAVNGIEVAVAMAVKMMATWAARYFSTISFAGEGAGLASDGI